MGAAEHDIGPATGGHDGRAPRRRPRAGARRRRRVAIAPRQWPDRTHSRRRCDGGAMSDRFLLINLNNTHTTFALAGPDRILTRKVVPTVKVDGVPFRQDGLTG